MAYLILKRMLDQTGHYYVSVPPNALGYDSPEAVQEAAVTYANNHPQDRLVLVREVAHVSVEPVVKMLEAPSQPHQVYRGGMMSPPEPEVPDGPKRDPQAKPRLLIVDRKATPAELVGHLMVVAEGRIVKNAFGALELADMPLSGAEVQEVANALRGNMAS